MLGTSGTTADLFDHRVIHGFRRPPNLKDLLVFAKLKVTKNRQPAISGSTYNTCTSTNCRYCPKFKKSGNITSPATKITSKCCSNFSCNSSNLIYYLKCCHCQKLYVGQTKRPFKQRLMEHFRDINKKDVNKPMGVHFNIPNHPDISVLEIYVLKFISSAPNSDRGQQERDLFETRWIHRLRTSMPYGLNSMD